MNFAKRTEWSEATNPLTHLYEQKKKRGEKILNLAESNPTECFFNFYNESLLKSFTSRENLSYRPDPQGLVETREAVAAFYAKKGIKISPEQVVLTASTSEAYGYLLRLLCDAGDKVLSPKPSYPLIPMLTGLSDVECVSYSNKYSRDDGWYIDLDSIEEGLKDPKVKAMIFINPNNPTGNFVQKNERSSIKNWAIKKKLPIISDEVFIDFYFKKDVSIESFAANNDSLTFTLNGLSKMRGFPQMKLGWIVVTGPSNEVKESIRRLSIIADSFLSVSAGVQLAAIEWLKNDAIYNEIYTRVNTNWTYLSSYFFKNEVAWMMDTQGGWHTCLEIDTTIPDDRIALGLLDKYSVYTYPGYLYDFDKEDTLVVSLLPPPYEFQEGIERIAQGLVEWKA